MMLYENGMNLKTYPQMSENFFITGIYEIVFLHIQHKFRLKDGEYQASGSLSELRFCGPKYEIPDAQFDEENVVTN